MTERSNLGTAAYNLARAELEDQPMLIEQERELIASEFAAIYADDLGEGFRDGIRFMAGEMGIDPVELTTGSMRAVWMAFAAGADVSRRIREQRAAERPGHCHYCGCETLGNLGGWWLCSRESCLEAFDAELDAEGVSPGSPPQSAPHEPVADPDGPKRYQIRLRANLEWACKEIRRHNASASYRTNEDDLKRCEALAERPKNGDA